MKRAPVKSKTGKKSSKARAPKKVARPAGLWSVNRTKSHIEITLRLRRLAPVKKNKATPRTVSKKPKARKKGLELALTIGLGVVSIAGALATAYIYLAPSRQPDSGVNTSFISAQNSLPVAPVEEKPAALNRSEPVRLNIPSINIDTGFIKLGKNQDNTMQVPSRYDIVGWYELSPSPGETGPSIIVGHHTSRTGRAIFYDLSKLKAGELVHVDRSDGQKITFKVDKVEKFDQQNFPTEAVYGNIDHVGLRLITCGGDYSYTAGRYSHNTVVYASQVPS